MLKFKSIRTIGVRVDAQLLKQMNEYVHDTELTVSDLMRIGTREYLLNHPKKQSDDNNNPLKELSGEEVDRG